MKLTAYLIGFILAFCVILDTQGQGLYFKMGGSYALPMGSQSLLESSTATIITGNNTTNTVTTEGITGSYGSGIYLNFSSGYKFTPFIGIDLNVSYQLGEEYTGNTSLMGGNLVAELTSKTKSQGIFISPTAMFMTGGGTVRPYALVGVIVGTTKIEDQSDVFLDNGDVPINYSIVEKTNGEVAFGFRGGAGLDLNVASKFSFYVEVIFNSISYYAKEKEVTSAILDGVDQLDNLTPRERNTVYVDKITETYIDGVLVFDDNLPTQELRKPLPLSNLSFGLGVKYRLSVD